MTDQPTPTDQGTAIHEALTAGDPETVEDLREDAYADDQTPPDPEPDDWTSPAEQFEADYLAAHARYQADHEAPQEDRETATADRVEDENTEANRG